MRLQTPIVSRAMAIASRSWNNCDKKETTEAIRFNWTPITRKSSLTIGVDSAVATDARLMPAPGTGAAFAGARRWLEKPIADRLYVRATLTLSYQPSKQTS